MKKSLISMILCLALLFCALPLNTFAEEGEYILEYLERDISTGDGYIIVEYDDVKVELHNSEDTTAIPNGADVTITIKAEIGSSIEALAFDNAPMNFDGPAIELNMTIQNFSDNHSVKVTYAATTFNCTVGSVGNGKVRVVTPATEEASVTLPMGEDFEFYAEAEEVTKFSALQSTAKQLTLQNTVRPM